MPDALDFVADVTDDGKLAARVHSRRIAVNLKARAGGQVRVRLSDPVRSPKQNDFYWAAIIDPTVTLYEEAGAPRSKEYLHDWFKLRFLPVVAGRLLRETGEEVDYCDHSTFPDGREAWAYTTTRLSVAAFSLYCDLIRAAVETELGVSLDEVPRGLRSGKIHESRPTTVISEPPGLTKDEISALF